MEDTQINDTLDTGFATQKLAACTLAALLMAERDDAFKRRLLSVWDEMRLVIEDNMESAFSRRDKKLSKVRGTLQIL